MPRDPHQDIKLLQIEWFRQIQEADHAWDMFHAATEQQQKLAQEIIKRERELPITSDFIRQHQAELRDLAISAPDVLHILEAIVGIAHRRNAAQEHTGTE